MALVGRNGPVNLLVSGRSQLVRVQNPDRLQRSGYSFACFISSGIVVPSACATFKSVRTTSLLSPSQLDPGSCGQSLP